MKKIILIAVLVLSVVGNAICEEYEATPEQRATIERVLIYGREDVRQAMRKEAEQDAEKAYNEWKQSTEKTKQPVKSTGTKEVSK